MPKAIEALISATVATSSSMAAAATFCSSQVRRPVPGIAATPVWASTYLGELTGCHAEIVSLPPLVAMSASPPELASSPDDGVTR